MLSESQTVLFRQQLPRLNRYAISLTGDPDAADDLVQDCLERAISRFDQFRPGTDLRSWLFTIMHNIFCDDFRRRNRRGTAVSLDNCARELSHPAPQPMTLELQEVDNGFRSLSRRQQQLLLMVAVDGKSHAEVAEHFGVAVGTVKSRLSRARTKLRRRQGLTRRQPPARSARQRLATVAPNARRRHG
jgi:RNA polymerase sigma-70 factor (ECF subfamily)